jgi:hypothetical protein
VPSGFGSLVVSFQWHAGNDEQSKVDSGEDDDATGVRLFRLPRMQPTHSSNIPPLRVT